MKAALPLATLLLAAGCGGDTLVVVTLDSPGGPLSIARLDCTAAAGAAKSTFRVGSAPIQIPPDQTFGIAVPASYSGRFDVTVDARAGDGHLVATDSGYVTLRPGFRNDLTLHLSSPVADGGSDGGAPLDLAGSDSAGPSCATVSNALLCEDFELGMVDNRKWAVYTLNGGSVAVESGGPRHGGRYALHAHTPTPQGMLMAGALTGMTPEYGLPPGGFHVRFWVYIASGGANADFVSAYRDNTVARIQQSGGQLSLHGEGGLPFNAQSNEPIPLATWTCLEWALLLPTPDGGSSGETHVWVNDGQEVASLHVTNLPAAIADQLAVGVGNSPNDPNPNDVWIDDVIVAARPIGCMQ
jgi:hypothetical protein